MTAVVAAVVVVAAAASGAAIASTEKPSVPPYKALSSTVSSTPNQAVNSEGVALEPATIDVKAFAVFQRSRTSTDAVPAGIEANFSAAAGANPTLSRKAEGADGTAWLIPGNGTMCMIAKSATIPRDTGSACVPATDAAKGELKTEEYGPHEASKVDEAPDFVSGLVPNGVKEVTLHLSNGGTVAAPVHENVYMQEVKGPVPTVTFNGPNGQTTVGGHS